MSMITIEALSTTADVDALVTGKGTYYGCSVLAGSVSVKDSLTSSSGSIIQAVGLPGLMLGGNGVRFQAGLSLDLTTGPVTIYFTRGA
jgi:hypothetical protein